MFVSAVVVKLLTDSIKQEIRGKAQGLTEEEIDSICVLRNVSSYVGAIAQVASLDNQDASEEELFARCLELIQEPWLLSA